jgi:hypothetical protein
MLCRPHASRAATNEFETIRDAQALLSESIGTAWYRSGLRGIERADCKATIAPRLSSARLRHAHAVE